MKVLFVSNLTGFGPGGARTEEIQLVRGIANFGCEVAVCSDTLVDELSGIQHFSLDFPLSKRAPAQLSHAVSQFKPDVIHVVGGGIRFLLECEKLFRTQISPWILTTHNVPPAERIFTRFHGNSDLHYAIRNFLTFPNVWLWSRFMKSAHFSALICHSQTVSRRLQSIGCPSDKILEIPFGSDLHPLAKKETPTELAEFSSDAWPKIVTIAGVAHHKGQADAVRIASRLLRDFPRLSYQLIGGIRDRKYRLFVEGLIRRLGLEKNVILQDNVTDSQKFAALREADLYIQPSHEEGFCIAFLEALVLVPRVIGADTGAILEMAVENVATRVVPAGDIDAFESGARELLALDVGEEVVRGREKSLAAKYSSKKYLDAHLQVYRRIDRRIEQGRQV